MPRLFCCGALPHQLLGLDPFEPIFGFLGVACHIYSSFYFTQIIFSEIFFQKISLLDI